ncbi:MAG TPA: PAS domain S-box protein [Longimicrobiaceae bacterium]|nr:PAS domain S-box protein [Longimicrobiaceae bacterium]
MRALLIAGPTSRESLQYSLTARGWRVTFEKTAEEGLQQFRTSPFPLVVVDCGPDGGGAEFCERLRDVPMGRAAYILVVTHSEGPATVKSLLDAGANDYLPVHASTEQIEGRVAYAECHLFAHPAADAWSTVKGYHLQIAELEETLGVQQASLEELFESAPEGIAVVDGQDRVIRINSEFTRLFGYSAEDARGRQVNEMIVPDNLAEEGRAITDSMVRGERMTLETVRKHRDGHLIDVSVLGTPIRVGDGLIGAYGIYRDITARKRGEAALRESEERYRALFNQSPVGVCLFDRELRIVNANDRLLHLLGSSREDLDGMPVDRLGDRTIVAATRHALDGETTEYEGEYERATAGPRLIISARCAPLRDSDGRVMGGIAVLEDITERVESAEQLRVQATELARVNAELRKRTLELESAMRARSRLYATMNHELRTPISAIMLYQEMLLEGTLGNLDEDQTQAVKHSQKATSHLLELVRDVLDLSKIEAGKVAIQPTEVDVRALLEDLLSSILPLARRHGSELQLEIGGEVPYIVTDPRRVRQILLNLLSNAAKFGRGRPIIVRSRPADGDGLCIEVVDEGVGIGPEDLQNIFEDFVQVGSAQESGTGLGLAISRQLAELLDASLEVESEVGRGSTFRLILPPGIGARVKPLPADASAI